MQAFPTEEAAFQAVADSFPRYVLPLDTYHAPTAAHTAVTVADQAHAHTGHHLAAVRLDAAPWIRMRRAVAGRCAALALLARTMR